MHQTGRDGSISLNLGQTSKGKGRGEDRVLVEELYLPTFTFVCLFIKIYPFLRNSLRCRHADCKSMLSWKGFTVSCIQCGIFISVQCPSGSVFQAENACPLGFPGTVIFNIITSCYLALVASFFWSCEKLYSVSYTHVLQMCFPTFLKVDGVKLQLILSVHVGLII